MNDPFLDPEITYQRLLKEYNEHKKLIIAIDFDDTVFPWTIKDARFPELWALIKECQELGFYLVAWTASAPERFDSLRQTFKENGIELSSINENPIPLKYGNHKKIYYNILLDDRSGLESAFKTLRRLIYHIKNG